MKKLTRSTKPGCLNNYQHGRNNWNDIRPDQKNEIWHHLDDMQNKFCAYCECRLNNSRHIEHFKHKDKYPKLTFDWNNLFGSCGHSTRCGHYKDSPEVGKYDTELLIKPDEENASDYLLFLTNGYVKPRSTLSEDDLQKAKETIRVFNLNGDSALTGSRHSLYKARMHIVTYLYELFGFISNGEFELSDWLAELESELNNISNQEYQTALKHYCQYNEPY